MIACVVMMVKNEIDILPYVIDHLENEDIDFFYIADNLSSDGTRKYLASKESSNFFVIDDPEVGYYQQVKMNRWIKNAVELGAEIIVPVDADEVWYAKDRNMTLGQALKQMTADVAVGYVYDMIPSNDSIQIENPLLDINLKLRTPERFPCVAYRYHPDSSIDQGNHGVSHPGVRDDGIIEIRHFQYRSLEHYKRKLRNGKIAYDATDLPSDFGSHWRLGGSLSDSELELRWSAYINQPGTTLDPAPIRKRKA